MQPVLSDKLLCASAFEIYPSNLVSLGVDPQEALEIGSWTPASQ